MLRFIPFVMIEILVLISALGSNDFKVREAAEYTLRGKIREWNLVVVMVIKTTTDSEVRVRLERINRFHCVRAFEMLPKPATYDWGKSVRNKYNSSVRETVDNIYSCWFGIPKYAWPHMMEDFRAIQWYIYINYGVVE